LNAAAKGAGGGVGGFAVQLAKHAGAYVIATAAPRSAAAVRSQGADEIVDYTAGPVTCAPVDAVLNLADIRPGQAGDLLSLLRPDGLLVSVTVPVAAPGAVHFVARNDPAQLTALAALIDAGVVRVDIAGARPLTDLPVVHREAEAGQLRGKTILLP
jgi:NADPH:quinone reductase-like Zn-dependent oxidoreductase